MKIKLNDIIKERSFAVAGGESWLAEIYTYFPTPKDQESPKIQADIKLIRIDGDRFKMVGSISYRPYLTCSRCGEPVRCAINNEAIDVIFQQGVDSAELPRNVELQAEDLDNYYYEKDILDLEAFINEWINIGIPSHVVHENVDPTYVCAMPMNASYVPKQLEGDEKSNPFAVLKDVFKKNEE